MKHHTIVLVTCLVIVFFAAMIPAAGAEDETNVSVSEDPDTIRMVTLQNALSLSADDGSARAAERSGQVEAAGRSFALSSKSAGAPDTEGLDWENTLGGSYGDGFWDLQPANDGNYLAAGTSGSWDIIDKNTNKPVPGFVHLLDAYIVKGNPANGNILWHKLIGGNGKDGAMSIRQTADGGYIFAGTSDSTEGIYAGLNHGNKDGWVVKLDANRAIQWQVMLGGSQNEEFISIRETPERDGYIVAGYTLSNDIPGAEGTYRGNTDMYVVRLDLEGNIVWQKIIGGDQYDFASSAIPASDGGYIVAGYTESESLAGSTTNHGYSDIVLMKLDAGTGNVVWSKLFGGKFGEATAFDNVIQPTPDGGYILVGQSSSSQNGHIEGRSHGSSDVWVVRFDDEYEIQWEALLGGVDYDDGTAIQQTADGSYVVVGRTMSDNSGDVGGNNGNGDLWVVKLNAEGNLLWQDALGGNGYEQSSAIQPTADDGFMISAFTRSTSSGNIGTNHGYEDAWLAKLKPRLVVAVKDADTSAFVPHARVVLTDIAHAEDREMNATSGRAVFTGSGISGQYRFGRGLAYSVKASAEKYHDGAPVGMTFDHDGELVTLKITALERPTIEKTFSITNVGVYLDLSDTAKKVESILGQKAGWREVFVKSETAVTKEDFGINEYGYRGLNDATFHWHSGHGGYDPDDIYHSAGIELYSGWTTDPVWGIKPITYNLLPLDVRKKWGGDNKWVVLDSCLLLSDPRWGEALQTSHGIFGFTTIHSSAHSPELASNFFTYAIDDDMTLADAWFKATKDTFSENPVCIKQTIEGPCEKYIPVGAAVRFSTEDQYNNDHLPGHGPVEPDDDPNDYKTEFYSWNCTKSNG